ncbi:MAG: thiamine pyrophosphate-dependent dehydrogenase E1 component subunit alpha [Nitriliruptorales bacterium]|nr:thiamine pyrophosphate-dependent dehydrogenase E1 component subunit alpha [Nitriliruptorales bacterium]
MASLLARDRVGSDELERLYTTMVRARRFEEAAAELWSNGAISGEFHSSVGEEAVAAGVVDHLVHGDALALDHRATGPLVARGLPLAALFAELQGHEDGLCRGWGGHMHLLSSEHLVISDGIVGAAGPTACGFALAARRLRPGRVAVAFFGEGATNQGMLLESFNLAVAWELPVLFVCKDSRWSITTRSRDVTGGDLDRRARSFGLLVGRADGADVTAVWLATRSLLRSVRKGRPAFLHVDVRRPDGHLLDDPLLRPFREPRTQAGELGVPMDRSWRRAGARAARTARGLAALTRRFMLLASDRVRAHDPITRLRRQLDAEVTAAVDRSVSAEIATAVAEASRP